MQNDLKEYLNQPFSKSADKYRNILEDVDIEFITTNFKSVCFVYDKLAGKLPFTDDEVAENIEVLKQKDFLFLVIESNLISEEMIRYLTF